MLVGKRKGVPSIVGLRSVNEEEEEERPQNRTSKMANPSRTNTFVWKIKDVKCAYTYFDFLEGKDLEGPALFKSIGNTSWTQIAFGFYDALALSSAGEVYRWSPDFGEKNAFQKKSSLITGSLRSHVIRWVTIRLH